MYCAAGTQASTAATAGTANVAVAAQDGALNTAGMGGFGWTFLVLAHVIVATFSLGALTLAMWKLRPVSGAHRAWAAPPKTRQRI